MIIIIITGSLWLVQRKGGSRNLHQRDVYLWKKHLKIEFNFVFQNEKISQRLNALHQQIWMILSIYKETWVLSKKLHQNYVMRYWSLILELTIGSISLKNWRNFVRELECLTISRSFCVVCRIPKKKSFLHSYCSTEVKNNYQEDENRGYDVENTIAKENFKLCLFRSIF